MGLWAWGVFLILGGKFFLQEPFFFFWGLNQPQTPRGDPPEELGRFKAFFDFWPGSSGGSSGPGGILGDILGGSGGNPPGEPGGSPGYIAQDHGGSGW